MPPQNECVATVKEVMAEVMREKNALVGRLNAMHQRIAEEKDPVTKVRRKVEWAAEKERSVEALNEIVASLQSALAEEDSSTHGSTTSREDSDSGNVSRAFSAAPLSPASSQPFTNERASLGDAFEMTMAKTSQDLSYEAGAAGPRQRQHWSRSASFRSSSLSRLALSSWSLPARLDKDESTSAPASSKAAGLVRRLSTEAALLPEQVRKSARKSAHRLSSSILRRVGWGPALQESGRVWDHSV
jgi:hypothetical protein